ncbi:MAG: hypothetical protein PHQ27_09635 [Victivallales bacterium]|nr:hypothetical protein [Victivallales bacterium]
MKQIGIGCLILLIIVIAGGVAVGLWFRYEVNKAGGFEVWKNKKISEFIDYSVHQVLAELPLNKQEKESITRVVNQFSQRLTRGEIPSEQVAKVILGFYGSSLPEAFIALNFQGKYLKRDTGGALQVNRFVNGLLGGKISIKDAEPFFQLVMVNPEALDQLHNLKSSEHQDISQKLKLREGLSEADISKAVDVLRNTANHAGMATVRVDLNFYPLLEGILARAAVASAAESSEAPETVPAR